MKHRNGHDPLKDLEVEAEQPAQSEPWPAPVPFEDEPLPIFPVQHLGGRFADFVGAVAQAFQVPVDMVALLALATIAAAAAKKIALRVRPGWHEALTLYAAVVMRPGERKTGVLSELTHPLSEWEREKARDLAPQITAAQRKKEAAEAHVKTLRQKGATEKELTEAYGELDAIEVPVAPRMRMDDATPEAIGKIIATNGGRIAALSSEGGLLENLAGRYARGMPNLDLILKGWDGREEWISDRMTACSRVRSPIITLGLAVQPDVARSMATKDGFRGRGLIGRFIYALPKSRMGARDVDPPPVHDDLRAWWRSTVRDLLEIVETRDQDGEIETAEIECDQDARKEIEDFSARLEPRLGEDGDLGAMTDWAAKLAGTTARIAGLLHLVDDPRKSSPVPGDAARRAVGIAEGYLEPHARAAIGLMGGDPTIESAQRLLEWIRRQERAGSPHGTPWTA